ncbi:tape measure protein [Pasteurella multocida]|uniref:tape measure protein n=1 Tax=Pasteurella multocida TaxID=747 RepID=UPI002B585295|nr:tape measure protein [Pasteurella multocida]MEB3470160.1 tape measure protein [Pasteurella multocida]
MSNQLTLSLKIKADLENAVKNIKALEAELQRVQQQSGKASSNFSKTGQQTEKAGRQAENAASGFRKLGSDAETAGNKLGKTRAGIESISTQLARFKTQLFSFAALTQINVGLQGLAQTSDEYRNYTAQIKLVSKSNQQAQATFQELIHISDETGARFAATAELYTRTYRSVGEAANSNEVLAFTKTINQALVVSGAGAQEANAALIQLSQGLAAGALRGEEFNSVSEQAPVILEILQRSLGKTRGELRKMAEEGLLTTEVIMTAVKENADTIQQQYDQMPKTIGRAVNELANAWLQFVGNTDNALSASSLVANAISLLAKSLDELGTILVFVSGAAVARLVGNFAQVALAFGRNTVASNANAAALLARTTIEHRAALAAVAMAGATDKQTLATQRLAMAEKQLALAKKASAIASATTAGGLLSGGLALLGGPVGAAITAVWGLTLAYQYLSGKERELEAQYQHAVGTLDEHIDKTKALTQARQNLSEMGGFAERLAQTKVNTESLDEAQKKIDDLLKRRDELLSQPQRDNFGFLIIDFTELDALDEKLATLKTKKEELEEASQALSQQTGEQLAAAFANAAIEGDALAGKLIALLAAGNFEEFERTLTQKIKESEQSMLEMRKEADGLVVKLEKELANATMTAAQQLEAFKDRAIKAAQAAGNAGTYLQPLINTLNYAIELQQKVEQAKTDKKQLDYVERLEREAKLKGLSPQQRRQEEIKEQGLTGEKLERALAADKQLTQKEADEEAKRKAKTAASQAASQAKKDANEAKRLAEEAANKTRDLNVQYLRLIGQETKADLLDVQNRYNQLLEMMQKANNVEGISLIKKMLPLEEAKIQLDGVQSLIDQAFQRQSSQEQQIQAQVSTGLITHFEGQQRLKDIYAQTVTEIEKQLPLLQQLAQMPGTQGQAAGVMLEQMKLKIAELKAVGNELEKAFKDGLTQGIQSSLMGLAQGTMTLKEAVRNLALTIVNSMAQIAAQQLAMQATSAVGGWFSAAASAAGGTVAAATGGYIRGPGTSTSDSIPARLSDGEFVVNAAMVRHYGVGFMHAINRGTLRQFNRGGLVSQPAMPSYREPGLSDRAMNDKQQQVVASPVNVQQTLLLDSAEVFSAGINSTEGTRALLTVIRANKKTLKQDLGIN